MNCNPKKFSKTENQLALSDSEKNPNMVRESTYYVSWIYYYINYLKTTRVIYTTHRNHRTKNVWYLCSKNTLMLHSND